ncbi:MAG TPA: DUF924 family protein [Casimicrobiaceae bacterium]|nr:DUF924 family protein [Casimicrobiaceae bacterium]
MEANVLDPVAASILEFWFGPKLATEDSPERGTARDVWFRKDAAFDADIRSRFGAAVAIALAGGYGEWCATAGGALARVLLLDQFTRNMFRDSAQAFAGDARALATAQDAVTRGLDRALDPYGRWFLYMPFEHAEDRNAQRRSLELFGSLAAETGLDAPLAWARKHAEVIERFGRYPHRNALLGRASTPEEVLFLEQPGSRF